ncbi:MAG: DUF1559 family PulG-like putative transporter [Armatimonadota bacterium]
MNPLGKSVVYGSWRTLFCSSCARLIYKNQQSPNHAKAVLYGALTAIFVLGAWIFLTYIMAFVSSGALLPVMGLSAAFIGIFIGMAVWRSGKTRGKGLAWTSVAITFFTCACYQLFILRYYSSAMSLYGGKALDPPSHPFDVTLFPLTDLAWHLQPSNGGTLMLLAALFPTILAVYAAWRLTVPYWLMIRNPEDGTLTPYRPSETEEAPQPAEQDFDEYADIPTGSNESIGSLVASMIAIIIIVLFLASFLFPVFGKAREKARGSTCNSNVRQIALAIQMYADDHGGQYPGINGSSWVTKIGPYLGSSQEMYECASDKTMRSGGVSYAYAGLLIGPYGQGIYAKQVISPSEVGSVVDATPTEKYPGGRMIGGVALRDPKKYEAEISLRHSKGTIVGFCDGHAKYFQGAINKHDTNNGAVRALFQAVPLGLVDNPLACVPNFTHGRVSAEPVAVGGEYCTRALLLAAAKAWKAKAQAPIQLLGFNGQYDAAGRPANYLWGTGDGKKPAGNAIPIARDAVVVIVARGSKISSLPERRNSSYEVDYPTLRQLFGAGYAKDSVQVYSFGVNSGTRRYLADRLGTGGKPLQLRKDAVTVGSDLAMVEKVANDPWGIGYCSSAFADPDRVVILALKAPEGKVFYYPQKSQKHRWVVPDSPNWPWTRTLYAEYGGAAWKADGSGIANVMLAPGGAGTEALRRGPLFGTGLWGAVDRMNQ